MSSGGSASLPGSLIDDDCVSVTTDTVDMSPKSRAIRGQIKTNTSSRVAAGARMRSHRAGAQPGSPDQQLAQMMQMQETMCDHIHHMHQLLASLTKTEMPAGMTSPMSDMALSPAMAPAPFTSPPDGLRSGQSGMLNTFRNKSFNNSPASNFGPGRWGRAVQLQRRDQQVNKNLNLLKRKQEVGDAGAAPLSARRGSALVKLRAMSRLTRASLGSKKTATSTSRQIDAADRLAVPRSPIQKPKSPSNAKQRCSGLQLPAATHPARDAGEKIPVIPLKNESAAARTSSASSPDRHSPVQGDGQELHTDGASPKTMTVLGTPLPLAPNSATNGKSGSFLRASSRKDDSKSDCEEPNTPQASFSGPGNWGLGKKSNAFGIRKTSNLATSLNERDRPLSARSHHSNATQEHRSVVNSGGVATGSARDGEGSKKEGPKDTRDKPKEQARLANPLAIASFDEPVLLSTDTRRMISDVLFLLATFTENVMVTYAFAIELELPTPIYVALTVLCFPVFLWWMYLNFHTAILQGWILIDQESHIKERYRKTWFVPDLLLTLPWDVTLGWLTPAVFRAFSGFRFLRVFRIVYILQPSNPVQERPVWMQWVSAFFWVAVVTHWAACSWIFAAGPVEQGFPDPDHSNFTFDGNRIRQYVAATYWTCATITSTGYGDVHADGEAARVVSTVWMWFGVIAIIWGGARVTQWMVVADPFVLAEMDKKRQLYALMANNSIPWKIQKSALSVYPVVLETSSHDYNSIIEELPRFLQDQIRLHVKLKLIRKVPIFRGVSHDCLVSVAQITVPEQYALDSNIIAYGEMGSEMFLLEHGIVEVYTYNDMGQEIWMANLKGGSFFGEISLLSDDCRRTATVRAVTNCIIYTLTKDSFDHVVGMYPDLKEQVEKEARKRVKDIKSVLTWVGNVRRAARLMRLQPLPTDRRPIRNWKRAILLVLQELQARQEGDERAWREVEAQKAEARAEDHGAAVPSSGTYLEPATFLPLQSLEEHEKMMTGITAEPCASITFAVPPHRDRGSRMLEVGETLPQYPPDPPPHDFTTNEAYVPFKDQYASEGETEEEGSAGSDIEKEPLRTKSNPPVPGRVSVPTGLDEVAVDDDD